MRNPDRSFDRQRRRDDSEFRFICYVFFSFFSCVKLWLTATHSPPSPSSSPIFASYIRCAFVYIKISAMLNADVAILNEVSGKLFCAKECVFCSSFSCLPVDCTTCNLWHTFQLHCNYLASLLRMRRLGSLALSQMFVSTSMDPTLCRSTSIVSLLPFSHFPRLVCTCN
jgi:hypothetical protein